MSSTAQAAPLKKTLLRRPGQGREDISISTMDATLTIRYATQGEEQVEQLHDVLREH